MSPGVPPTSPPLDLGRPGRYHVVGAGGPGMSAIALTLAEGGASIVINARSNRAEADAVGREIEAAGGKALVHIGDVADAVAVQAMADAAVKQFGRIDILFNNAALRRANSSASGTTTIATITISLTAFAL